MSNDYPDNLRYTKDHEWAKECDGEVRVGITAFAVDQLNSMRPFPEAAQFRTEIDGLYLCGASSHPGGGVHAACGGNQRRRGALAGVSHHLGQLGRGAFFQLNHLGAGIDPATRFGRGGHFHHGLALAPAAQRHQHGLGAGVGQKCAMFSKQQ